MITTFKIFEYVKITEKPSFKKWFRNSKVVDDYDNPLLVFHGFNFDKSIKNSSILSLGFYFTTEPKFINTINLTPVYLSLQNPKYISANDWIQMINYNFSEIKEIKKDLINKGYDGIIIKKSNKLKIPQYVTFSSNLAKSAIKNNGDFDINNFIIDENNQSELEDKKWYYNFIDFSEIEHYYNLSKEHNVEIHFFETNDPDISAENLLPVTVFTDEYTYNKYYSDFSETDENFDDDPEITNILFWLKTKKYNL